MRVSPVSFGGLSILESSNKGINGTRYCPWSPVGQNTFHQESLAPGERGKEREPNVTSPEVRDRPFIPFSDGKEPKRKKAPHQGGAPTAQQGSWDPATLSALHRFSFWVPLHFKVPIYPTVTKGQSSFHATYKGLEISKTALSPSLLKTLLVAVTMTSPKYENQ